MSRLIILLIAFILAFYAQSLIADAESPARFVWRDGLILSVVAIVLFGIGIRRGTDRASADNLRSLSSQATLSFPNVLAVVWLIVLLGLGMGVRYWAIDALPTQCIGAECTTLMQLADPSAFASSSEEPASVGGQPPLLFALMQAATSFVETPVEAIRWTGLTVGVLTLLAFFLFASQVVQIPAALLGLALMIQLPWHVWASATGDSRITLPLFVCTAGWLILAGLRQRGSMMSSPLWTGLCFVGAGAALAALRIDTAILQIIPALWLLLLLVVAIVALWPRGMGHLISGAGGLLIGFLGALGIAAAVGLLPESLDVTALLSSSTSAGSNPATDSNWQWLVQNLFYRGDFGAAGSLFDAPILGLLLGSLTVTGIAALLMGSINNAGSTNVSSTDVSSTDVSSAPDVERASEGSSMEDLEENEGFEEDVAPSVSSSSWPLYLAIFTGLAAALVGLGIANASGAIDPLTDSPASLLLILLPMLFMLATLSINALFTAFQAGWSPLIDGRRLAFLLLGVALLVPALTMSNVLENFSGIKVRGNNPLDPLLIEYLAEELPSAESGSVTYLAPADFVEDPTTGLQLGSAFNTAIESGRLRPFNPAEDLLFVNGGPGDLVYLLDGNNRGLLELMSQVFPSGYLEPQPNEDPNDEAQLVVLRVSMESILANRGLRLTFFDGNDTAAVARQPSFVLDQAAPAPSWDQLPIDGPFSAEWTGTLLVPQSGQYRFQAQSHPNANLGLTLDNIAVLDTGNGINFGDLMLARGPYRLRLRYRSEQFGSGSIPSVFGLTWQPPEQNLAEIPLTLLQSTLPPNAGLLGSYYAGERFEEPELVFQKDLLVGMDADLPEPYSVLWRGKLAASRAGEYTLGVLTGGQAALSINGRMVVDVMSTTMNAQDDNSAADGGDAGDVGDTSDAEDNRNYVEGVIYLRQGWHDVQVAYVPTAGSQGATQGRGSRSNRDGLELFWVPPGGSPEVIPMSAMVPYLGRLSMLEFPVPPAPPLRAPHLGNSQFALSVSSGTTQPSVHIMAESLPPMEIVPVWQTQAGCGSGPEQFLDPHGLAIDPDSGLVYVTDTGNRRIVSLNEDGILEREFDGQLFPELFDIAMQYRPDTGQRQPLVLDAGTQMILRLDPADPNPSPFVPLAMSTAFYRPRGFDVDSGGNIAVADTGGARVVLLSPDGDMIFEAGGRDSALGLGQPVDALAVSGQLWAITAEDGRLWQVTSNVAESGSLSAVLRTDTLNGPRLAALDTGGVFVADPVRGLITYHRADGQPLFQANHPAIIKPVGIDLALVDDELYMAISDGHSCSISLWQLDRAMFGL